LFERFAIVLNPTMIGAIVERIFARRPERGGRFVGQLIRRMRNVERPSGFVRA
jgi:hypothetical protein